MGQISSTMGHRRSENLAPSTPGLPVRGSPKHPLAKAKKTPPDTPSVDASDGALRLLATLAARVTGQLLRTHAHRYTARDSADAPAAKAAKLKLYLTSSASWPSSSFATRASSVFNKSCICRCAVSTVSLAHTSLSASHAKSKAKMAGIRIDEEEEMLHDKQ